MRILIALLLVSISTLTFGQSSKHYPKVKFSSAGESKADTLEFNAKVKSIYKCPPCPEGAQCKPCIGDHVEVTDGKSSFRVFTHELSTFKVRSNYRFLVRFRSSLHRIDNIELVRVLK